MNRKGTTKSQGNKHELDKFYTKDSVVDECLSYLRLDEYDCIIEPSAGNGAFSNKIKSVQAFDLLPENENIQQADWFKLDKQQFSKFNNILVVGNPPFGTSGNLAHAFMVESMKFADTVAFILPKGFKKESMKNRIPLNFELEQEIDLPKNSFTLEGTDYGVPCVFHIWQKSDKIRTKTTYKTTTELFKFVKKSDADFRVQRVGGKAGTASFDLEASEASNYFVKRTTDKYTDEELVNFINNISFPSIDHTTGPRSLPKGELIHCLEQKIGWIKLSDDVKLGDERTLFEL